MRRRGKDAWELRVYQGIDPDTRRQRWLSKTVHGTERFARAQLVELVAEGSRARIRAGTVAELLDQWLAAASSGWSASTVSHTRSIVDCHLKPHLGHLDLAKLTTADIDDFYAHLLRAGGRDDRPLAPGTVARVHGVLHRALTQAVRWDWIWLNPASNATPPRVAPSEVRPPSPEQVAMLLEWASREDPPLHCYLRLAASTGARRSQLLALRWGDVDEKRAAIAFTRALVEGPDGPELRSTKTHRTYRVELRRRNARRVEGASRQSQGSGPERRHRTDGRRVRVQLASRQRESMVAELADEAVHRREACRGPATLPAPRSSPLHGHRDARRRRPDCHGVPAPQPRPGLYHAERVRPLDTGRDRRAAEILAVVLAAGAGQP
jgi:integrase